MLGAAVEYNTRSTRLWQEAQTALVEANGLQASEKLWGAAAQAVKAVGEDRGWPHRSHRDLYNVISRLQVESGQDRLGELFGIAIALHQNFYEEWMPLEEVQRRAANIEELREGLADLLQP